MLTDLYEEKLNRRRAFNFILESVLPVTVTEDEDGDEELVDVDSVPKDVLNTVDKALDNIVSKEDYDDTELEELLSDEDDDELGDDEVVDIEDNVIVAESVNSLLNRLVD